MSGLSKNCLAIICITMLVLLTASAGIAAQPAKGGTLRVAMVTEPKGLDSCHASWAVGLYAGNIFNSLLETDEKMNIVPGLASSYKVDYANKQYLFSIRKNVKWHDGKPLTVEDVKFSLEKQLPTYDNRGLYLKGTKVKILNDTDIVVKPGTWAPGIQLTRFASADWVIYPKHLLENANFNKSKFRRAPIGTGPFKFSKWVRGSHIVMVRNDSYWKKGKPYLDKIIVKFIKEPSMMIASLTTGEVDFVFRGLPYEAYKNMQKNPKLNVIVDYKPNYKLFITYNHKHPILSNLKVRQAISHAIDIKDIANKATSGLCRPSYRLFAPEFMPENPNLVTYAYDPAKSETLLDQAGYPKKADGMRFNLKLTTRGGEAEEEKTADMLVDYLKKVGIGVELKRADFSTIVQLNAQYKFDLSLEKRWILPVYTYQGHHSRWIMPGKSMVNVSQYSSKETDHWYDEWAFNATSEEDRIKALFNVETQITKDIQQTGLFDISWMYVWSSRVGNAFVPSRNWVQCESYENLYIKK